MEKGLAVWNRKESKVGKLKKVKKRNEREVQRGWISCFFISVQGSAEREYFKKKEREELFLGIQRPRVSGRSFFGFPCSFPYSKVFCSS